MVKAAVFRIPDLVVRVWVSLGFIVGLTTFIWTFKPFLVFRLHPTRFLLFYLDFVAF